jgi:hypothetical protein
MFIYSSSVLSQ